MHGRLDVWRESSNVWWYPSRSGEHEKRLRSVERAPKAGITTGSTSRTEPAELREQWQSLFGADPPPKTPFVTDCSGDCLSASVESPWRPQSGDAAIAGANRRRRRTPRGCHHSRKDSRGRRDRTDPGVARHQASGDRAERRILISHQALRFAVANRTNDHQQSLVRTAVLRPEAFQEGADQ